MTRHSPGLHNTSFDSLLTRTSPVDIPRWEPSGKPDPLASEGLHSGIDPMTFSVLLNRYYTTAWEMTLGYENAAWSTVISLARDFSCGIMDGGGRLVAMKDGIPLHIAGTHIVVAAVRRAFEDDISDGDIVICNHAHSGNSHIGDLVMMTPVVWNGEVIFWAVAKGHQLDVGAPVPSSMPHTATAVWSEGLQIPPLRIVEQGMARTDVIRLFLENVRYPELIYGDLLAQQGCVRVGKRLLLDMIDEYGIDTIRRYTEEMQEYASRRTRAEIATWPDGTYRGEAWIDSDGNGNVDIPIRAEVIIEGDRVHVDFTGSAPQVSGAINSSYGNTIAAGVLPVTFCLEPDIPRNQGCLDSTSVNVGPEGSITNCKWPGACALDTGLTGTVIQQAVWKALAEAIPSRVVAGICKATGVAATSGEDRRADRPQQAWNFTLLNAAGGGGATRRPRRLAAVDHVSELWGDAAYRSRNGRILYPVVLEVLEIEPMASGAGEWVGGPGVRCELKPFEEHVLEHWVYGDGAWNPPHGVAGGEPGIGGGHYLLNDATGKRQFYSAKSHLVIHPDETWVSVSSGGGGYGVPLDRDPTRVMADVLDDLVTPEVARDVYGVVCDSEKGCVMEKETSELREQMRSTTSYEAVAPTTVHAGRWYEDNLQAGESVIVDAA